MNVHRLFAGLAGGLIAVGHQVPGAIGWICSAIGWGIATAVDKNAVFGGPPAGMEPKP